MNINKDNTLTFIKDDGDLYCLMVSPPAVVKKILELASLKPGETLLDLGSGDGRVIISAVQEYDVKTMGVESKDDLVEYSRKKIRELHLEDRCDVIEGDLKKYDLSRADVVVFYLGAGDVTQELKSKFEKKLSEGGRIITVNVTILGLKPLKEEKVLEDGNSHFVYMYKDSTAEVT